MTTIATICARGGSQGLPRKNVRLLGGKPLIAWTIEQAFAAPSIDAVFVSTDDEEIAAISRTFGASVPYVRPKRLSMSSTPKHLAIVHLVNELERSSLAISRIVDLDPTSPLRTAEDIEAAIALLDSETDVVITAYEADKNPYFNMIELKPDGSYGLVVGSDAATRQSAPRVYSMNASVYVWHRRTLEKGLWGGRVNLYVMPRERSIDIDTELDFRLVEFLITAAGFREQ